jgi:hypothetical protein
MDAIHHFSTLASTTTRKDFLTLYNDYCVQTNLAGQILFQMKHVSHLELNTHLFKIYCSDKILNSYQQYILIKYIGKMTCAIRIHHPSMSNADLDFRRSFVEFIQFANTRISIEGEYWFRILFNALLGEQHIGLAIIYLEMLEMLELLHNNLDPKDRIACIQRVMCKNGDQLPNLMDYCLKMYHLQHTSINWPLFVDAIISIIHRYILYYRKLTNTCTTFDSKLLHVLFLFLNHDDNQELFYDILSLINTVIMNNYIDYNPQLYQVLFTPHNLMAISNLTNLFQPNTHEKQDVELEILNLFTLIFQTTECITIPRDVIQHTLTNLDLYNDFPSIIIVLKFASIAFKYYPDIIYNTRQIKITLELIRDEDVVDDLIHVLLNHMLDIFLYTVGTCQMGLEKDIFALLVNNYQFLTITSKSRMIMSLVVYEFMKIGHTHPELGYQHILKQSGYLNILDEDDNIYNRDILLKIKYNYICTSLEDKCKEWILDNSHQYNDEQVRDVLDLF